MKLIKNQVHLTLRETQLRINRDGGFTLIELMVTVLIVGIVVGWAIPSFTDITGSARMNSAADTLRNSVHAARNAALSQSTRVGVCASADINAANPVCRITTPNRWTDGWIVFEDCDGDGLRATTFKCDKDPAIAGDDAAEPILSVGQAFGSSILTGATNKISYNELGRSDDPILFSFVGKGYEQKTLSVEFNSYGRVRVIPN